jgi:hypothetical protein
MRTIKIACTALAIAVLCAGAPGAEGAENLAPDFTALPPQSKIVVAPPDIELFEVTAGGLPEPRADWSDTARKLTRAELEKRRPSLGVDTVELDQGSADELSELLSLHAAIARSIALHQFGRVPLPTKNGHLDWSFGDAMKPLQERTGARYALFIWVRDGYSSASRKAVMGLTVILTLGHVVPLGAGQEAYASLVDLETGRVLWFNMIARHRGDLREADSAAKTVDALLEDFPAAGTGGVQK